MEFSDGFKATVNLLTAHHGDVSVKVIKMAIITEYADAYRAYGIEHGTPVYPAKLPILAQRVAITPLVDFPLDFYEVLAEFVDGVYKRVIQKDFSKPPIDANILSICAASI